MPSFKTPTSEQVETALQRMRSPEFAAYFLSRLDNPKWIAPLVEAGIFSSPPPTVAVDEGQRYPHWPASKFLARMAQYSPRDVAEILESIETDNPSVVGDLVKAALAMDHASAVTLVPSICRYSDAGLLWIYMKDASQLCIKLAESDHATEAIALATALFRPRLEDSNGRASRRDEHWYRKCLRDAVPSLTRVTPAATLEALGDWLDLAIAETSGADEESGTDYSHVWRPAIEEHAQNHDHSTASVLLGVLRHACEIAVHEELLSLEDVLAQLSPRRFTAFERLRIHLVDKFAEQAEEVARGLILTREWLDSSDRKYEYGMLLGHRWSLLTPDESHLWLQWIDDGPDMSDFDEWIERGLGRPATEADRASRVRCWQLEKLHWVRGHLTGAWKDHYENLLAEFGEPEFAYMNMTVGARWGSDSPFTVEELQALPFEDAVRAITEWRPDEGGRRRAEPSYEGLANTFERLVLANAEASSAEADQLVGAPDIYIRSFLSAVAQAAKEGRAIDISAMARLGEWILGRPRPASDDAEHVGARVVTDWQWTRDSVSRLLLNIFQARHEQAAVHSMDHKAELWPLLETLCTDRVESTIVRDRTDEDPRVHDYLDFGINSARGRAVEGVLEYARWVAVQLDRVTDAGEFDGDFALFPEVRAQLEWQLAPENRSVEVLSVIGSRVGLLYWLDKVWLEANVGAICGVDPEGRSPGDAPGWAAWNAVLVWNRPHVELYRMLRAQFGHAVDQAADVVLPEHARMQPMNQLGEHLLLLYGRGQIGLEEDDGVIRRLIGRANPELRRHAMGFVGRVLDGDEDIPRDMIDRFQSLWDLYWAGVGRSDAESCQGSMLFGTWFSCGKFDEQWALDRMLQFVEADPTPEPDHSIAEQLAALAPLDTETAIRILDRMVHGDKEGWRVHGWLDAATTVLRAAMASGGSARGEAEALIQYLGRRGYEQFGQLLRETS